MRALRTPCTGCTRCRRSLAVRGAGRPEPVPGDRVDNTANSCVADLLAPGRVGNPLFALLPNLLAFAATPSSPLPRASMEPGPGRAWGSEAPAVWRGPHTFPPCLSACPALPRPRPRPPWSVHAARVAKRPSSPAWPGPAQPGLLVSTVPTRNIRSSVWFCGRDILGLPTYAAGCGRQPPAPSPGASRLVWPAAPASAAGARGTAPRWSPHSSLIRTGAVFCRFSRRRRLSKLSTERPRCGAVT